AESNAKPSNGFDYSTLGFPASLVKSSAKLVLPIVNIGGGFNQLGDNAGNITPFDIFSIFASLNKVSGKHSMKVGVDARMYRESNIGYGNSSGNYVFRTDYTRGPLDNSSSAPLGQDLAAFLLGLPSSGGFDVNTARTNQAAYYALYFEDDYRVRPNLTLNLGVRYDKDLGTTERYNRSLDGFNATLANPVGAAAQAAYVNTPAALLQASQFHVVGGPTFASSSNQQIYKTKSHYFSPRFGFAWTPAGPAGKTVIRGGFSQFYFPIITTGVNQPGFSQTTDVVGSLNSYLSPNVTLSNPFPNGIQAPSGASLGAATNLGKGLTFFNPAPLNPYSLRWAIGVQRQIGKDMVVEVGYIGNHAVHLGVDTPIDSIPRQYLSTSLTRDQPVIDRNTALVTNPLAGLIPGTTLNGSTVGVDQLLRPFPQFTSITEQQASVGSSYFHMGQVRFEKRFGYGLQFSANYLHSRLMERRSRLNETDPTLEKRVSSDDRPNRFVTNFSYELPFGKGKPFGSNPSALMERLVGGWVVAAVYTLQSGALVGFGNSIYLGGPLNYNSHNADHAFDTTQFNTVSSRQLSNNIRYFPSQFNNIRQDGSNTMDASLLKNTLIVESIKLQFRVEFFNVWNHPEFNGPDTNPTSSTFGKITSQANDIGRVGQLSLRLIF
ncbi:MAG: TonB-dependent receptor, partial [Acidobacteriota bacterium]|nr:TonB-dependent receptor [Acidobacteriota bacterium]